MTTYYHLRRTPRPDGAIINPGMRSILLRYQHNNMIFNAWRIAFEYSFESHREKIAPSAPCRLDSNFVFLSIGDALKQKLRIGGSRVLFEVEVVDAAALRITTDFEIVTRMLTMDGLPYVQKAADLAKQYWSGIIKGTPEMFTTSPLRVLRTVQTFP